MKYAPLQTYLKKLPASKQCVTLSFVEIEKIIGAKLPKSAFTYREWWANQEGKTVEVVAAFPELSTWNGLPVDVVTGLEAGLVKPIQPALE